jgi:hypothetical protein
MEFANFLVQFGEWKFNQVFGDLAIEESGFDTCFKLPTEVRPSIQKTTLPQGKGGFGVYIRSYVRKR